MTRRQLNIRLSLVDHDRLDALAFVRREPPASLARDIVLEYLAGHTNESGLKRTLEARAEHDLIAGPPATVRELHPKGR